MLSVLSTVFGGPLVGILGSIISGVVGYFETKQRMQADKAKYDHEVRLQELNMSARGKELENEQLIATMKADSANLRGSYRHDASAGEVSRWVSNTLRLVRPFLTVTLMGIIAYMVIADKAGIELQSVAMKILFLAEVALSWWFADRRRAAATK